MTNLHLFRFYFVGKNKNPYRITLLYVRPSVKTLFLERVEVSIYIKYDLMSLRAVKKSNYLAKAYTKDTAVCAENFCKFSILAIESKSTKSFT